MKVLPTSTATPSWLLLTFFFAVTTVVLVSAQEVIINAGTLTASGGAKTRTSVAIFGDNKNSAIAGTVNIGSAGTYRVGISYSNGDTENRPTQLRVDSQDKGTFPNPPTRNFNNFEDASMDIVISNTGSMAFSLWATEDAGGPNIETISFKKLGSGTSGGNSGSSGSGVSVDTSTSAGSNADKQGTPFDGENEWFVQRVKTYSEFTDDSGAELFLDYDIHQVRDFGNVRVKLLDKDCKNDAKFVTVTQNIVPHTDQAKRNQGLELLYLNINIDETKIYQSNIWSYVDNDSNNKAEGFIEMCVKLELVEPSMSFEPVSTVITEILQYLSLDATYKVSNMGITEIKDDISISDANVDYNVKTCICDDVNNKRKCNTNPSPMKVNAVLRLCIYAESDEVEIFGIDNLELSQKEQGASIVKLYSPIFDTTANALTDVTFERNNKDGIWANVATNVLVEFFKDAKPEPLQVTGAAWLSFRQNRRLGRRRHLIRARFASELTATESKTTTIAAAMNEDEGLVVGEAGSARFETSVPLEASVGTTLSKLGMVTSSLIGMMCYLMI